MAQSGCLSDENMKNSVNHDNFKEKKLCLKINKAYVYAFLKTASGLLLVSQDNTKHETTEESFYILNFL